MLSINQSRAGLPPSGNQTADLVQHCTFLDLEADVSWYKREIAILLITANAVTSTTAITFNIFVLCAIIRTPALHSPKNGLLCSLITSDLFVGLFSQTSFMVKVGFGNVNLSRACFLWFMSETFGAIGAGATFLNLFCLSVERYTCLMYPLRYEAIVTKNRVLFVVLSCWIFTSSSALSRFVESGLGLLAHVIIPLLLVLNCYLHLRILLLARHHKKAIRDINRNVTSNQVRNLEVTSRAKSALTMTYLFALYLICYTPLFWCFVAITIEGKITTNLHVILGVAATIVYINSSLNPIFYCCRMREIRRAVFRLLKSCKGSR